MDIIKDSIGQKKKERPEQIDGQLSKLKLVHSAQIPWGEVYGSTSKDHQVMEFAWKDANVVLFMSTVHDGKPYGFFCSVKSLNTMPRTR